VAHDLNNILAEQYFEVDLLPMTEAMSPGVRKGLEHIRASAERAAKMVSQLLLFSRRQLMQMRDLDLNPVIDNFSKLLRRLIGEQIQFQIRTQAEPLWIHADAGMIEQVLMNLALNARDAMPKGGQLLIETTVVTVAESGVPPQREVQPGRYACLSVSDTGPGIPSEVLPKIFEPFFTTKDVGKGSGLGLASVDGIVKQHKGWIDVDNRPGEGVTFRIYFPALTMPAMEPPKILEPARNLGGTETILLVEDDLSVSKLIGQLLQQKGYVVLAAANGLEALKLWGAQRANVALLLTDIIMPNGMSGLELAKQLLLEKSSLKVVYMSGYSNEFAANKLDLREGVNFLQKPFVGQQLLKAIRENLDKPAKS
jgi:CheY-like chemotaxis protein